MGAEFTIAVNLNRNIGDMKESPLLPGPNVKPVDKIEKKLTNFIHKLNKMPLVKKNPLDLGPVRDWFDAARTPDILEILGNSLRIMEAQLAQFQLAASPPDILIEPELHEINFMDFHRADEAIQIGYQATMKVIDSKKDLVKEKLSLGDKLQQAVERFFSRINR
jgi:NTE family protein